jgi:hypothetical protein
MSLGGSTAGLYGANIGTDIFAETITQDVNIYGDIIGYSCGGITETNLLPTVVIPYAYDLLYDCSIVQNDAVRYIASRLLRTASDGYQITPDGARCDGEPPDSDSSFQNWVLAVNSNPIDSQVDNQQCTKAPDASQRKSNECCIVVEGAMTFTPSGTYEYEELSNFVTSTLDSETIVDETGYRTYYIGSFVELPSFPSTAPSLGVDPSEGDGSVAGNNNGGDSSSPVVNGVEGPTAAEQGEQEGNLSTVGRVLIGGILALFILASILIVRRRRRKRYDQHVVDAITKSSCDAGDDGIAPTVEIDVLSDRIEYGLSSPSQSDWSSPRKLDSAPEPNSTAHFYDPSFSPSSRRRNAVEQQGTPRRLSHSKAGSGNAAVGNYEYTFDLSDAMKLDVMGTHARDSNFLFGNSAGAIGNIGPTSMAVVPPYPMEETSDSEADSWAQTDATVGSIEDRLEDITAEI